MSQLYDNARISPGEEFWNEVGRIDRLLGDALRARPLGSMEIDDACAVCLRAFTSALNKERHGKQARTGSA